VKIREPYRERVQTASCNLSPLIGYGHQSSKGMEEIAEN